MLRSLVSEQSVTGGFELSISIFVLRGSRVACRSEMMPEHSCDLVVEGSGGLGHPWFKESDAGTKTFG